MQDGQGVIPEGGSFPLVIPVPNCEAEALYCKAGFLQIFQQKLYGLLGGAPASSADAGGKDFSLFQGDYGADIQNASRQGRNLSDPSAVL